MFPNPQDSLPLPPRPDLEQYEKQAKDLVEACKSGTIHAWTETWIETLARLRGVAFTPELPVDFDRWIDQVEDFARRKLDGNCVLADAQSLIARAHGFVSWSALVKQIEGMPSRFEAAADAIITGDIDTLRRLLLEEPELIRARSAREHRATLLHYVSANGVEGYRQETPHNIVEIAEVLLDAGAEVDAEADVYGGNATTLYLAATSVHPYRAGVQEPLLDTLLRYGAKLEHPRQGTLVSECLANGRSDAAEFLARRGAPFDLIAAAGIGRLDVVKRLLDDAKKEELDESFRAACGYRRRDVVEFLLQKGVDIAATDHSGQTPLHHAVIGGDAGIVALLLRHDAPLEVRNEYGGTVMGQALWCAAHGGSDAEYVPVLETLIAAGANVPPRHPPITARIDELLARQGSESDDTRAWYGEKPKRRT